jgi:hypothetical protein
MIYNRLYPKFEPVPLKINVYSQTAILAGTVRVGRHYYYYYYYYYYY